VKKVDLGTNNRRPMPIDIDRILRETFVAQAEHTSDHRLHQRPRRERARKQPVELPLLVLADNRRPAAGGGEPLVDWPGRAGAELGWSTRRPSRPGISGLRWWRWPRPWPWPTRFAPAAGASGWHPLPNDVLAAGRKLAGILVEVLPDRRHVIGIGLNTNNTLADAPPELQATAATLRDLSGVEQDQTAVLIRLLTCLESEFSQLSVDLPALQVAQRVCALQQGAS